MHGDAVAHANEHARIDRHAGADRVARTDRHTGTDCNANTRGDGYAGRINRDAGTVHDSYVHPGPAHLDAPGEHSDVGAFDIHARGRLDAYIREHG